ncbi:DUF4855 domain-containing protein [Paenibacillus marinisediminis]
MLKRSLALLLVAALTASISFTASAKAEQDLQLVNLALNKNYTIETPYPVDTLFGKTESTHADDTDKQLTDGEYGGTVFSNKAFIGRLWQGSRIVTLDLGEVATIQEIYLNVLQDNKNGIFFPESVGFSLSADGKKWQQLEDGRSTKPTTDNGPLTQKIGITNIDRSARYVKLDIPVSSWLFMDELEVMGTHGDSGRKLHHTQDKSKKDDGYPKMGSKESGRIDNQVLLYTGEWQYEPKDWISYTKEDLKPYVSYVDQDMKRKDYMFDGFLFLPYGPLLNGANFAANTGKPTNKEDWIKHLDRLFRSDYELGALNQAVGEAKADLKRNNYEAKVSITIPYPRVDQSNFGDVDGDGINENMNIKEIGEEQALINRQKVIKWYIDEVNHRWDEANYSNLKLASFYWYSEFVSRQTSVNEDELLQWTSEYVHSQDLRFQWIPYYFARGWSDWKENGFDTALMQPNYMFHNTTIDRLDSIAQAAYEHGMGVEIEMNDAVLTDPNLRNKYYAYLNKGVEHGYMKSFKAFYQQVKTLKKAAESTDPDARAVYDNTYKYLTGKYRP